MGDRPGLRVVEDQAIGSSRFVEQARLSSPKAEALVALGGTRQHDNPRRHGLSKGHDRPWTRSALVYDFLGDPSGPKQVPEASEFVNAIEVNDH